MCFIDTCRGGRCYMDTANKTKTLLRQQCTVCSSTANKRRIVTWPVRYIVSLFDTCPVLRCHIDTDRSTTTTWEETSACALHIIQCLLPTYEKHHRRVIALDAGVCLTRLHLQWFIVKKLIHSYIKYHLSPIEPQPSAPKKKPPPIFLGGLNAVATFIHPHTNLPQRKCPR